ncbi:MAG: demethoxyubiquinone hydroxylase family protein [Brevundimonas sp.]|uniref:demethoxyubiquinone hydroxylase family protein n=1 Tax=Brevundimonas sp. TaxID=1871086 RepID=UPI00391D2E6E
MANQPDEATRRIRRILRVNHAGEHGAVSIYQAQLRRLKANDEVSGWLNETLDHERRHRTAFLEAMPQRGVKPCRALVIWKSGGSLLGWLSSAFGSVGVLVCTQAVEETVHRHLLEQISFLDRADPELADVVRDILKEEVDHLVYARDRLPQRSLILRMARTLVSVATEALIAISTRGDSFRLRHDLKTAA